MAVSMWYADGANAPSIAPRAAARLAGVADSEPLEVTLGFFLEALDWFDDVELQARSFMVGYGLARAAAAGKVGSVPTRLSAIPSLIESKQPDIAVVGAVRRGETLVLPGSVGWADVLARHASAVVVEVDEGGADFGNPEIPGNVVATAVRARPPQPMRSRPADDVDLTIGSLVASVLPPEPTVQFGPGGIGEGIVAAIDRPVSVWSGLITDGVADLDERGLLVDRAVGAYTWGSDRLARLAERDRLQMVSSTVTHDLTRLSAIPRFVACNTALQVALDGSVNLERVGGRVVSSIGGHADFCTGASRSVGGLSIIAVRSTTNAGASTIVPKAEVVSTARSDVNMVVTEHGVADLRGLDDHERRRAIAAVAAPEHRDGLLRDAASI